MSEKEKIGHEPLRKKHRSSSAPTSCTIWVVAKSVVACVPFKESRHPLDEPLVHQLLLTNNLSNINLISNPRYLLVMQTTPEPPKRHISATTGAPFGLRAC